MTNGFSNIIASRAYLSDVILGSVCPGMVQNVFSTIMAQASLDIVFLCSIFYAYFYFGLNKIRAIVKIFLIVPIAAAFSYFFIVRKEKYKEKPLMLYYLVCFLLVLIFYFL